MKLLLSGSYNFTLKLLIFVWYAPLLHHRLLALDYSKGASGCLKQWSVISALKVYLFALNLPISNGEICCLTLLFIYLENGKNMKKINGIYILRLTNRCVQYLGISLYVSVTTIKRLTVKTP